MSLFLTLMRGGHQILTLRTSSGGQRRLRGLGEKGGERGVGGKALSCTSASAHSDVGGASSTSIGVAFLAAFASASA